MSSGTEFEQIMQKFEEALISLDRSAAKNTIKQASLNLSPIQLVEQIVAPVLERIATG